MSKITKNRKIEKKLVYKTPPLLGYVVYMYGILHLGDQE